MDAHDLEETIAWVFVDIGVIVLMARLLGIVTRRLRQPSVIAEIIAALALGPSVLGALPGNPTDQLFPPEVRPFLAVIAALGLTIYMFVVGLELDLGLIRGRERAAGIISLSSVLLPFGMGVGLAVWLHGRHQTVDGSAVEFMPFALFIGSAMSITAFPILARILAERQIHRTPTGALTLACAAVDDVVAWILLAGVLAVVRASGTLDLLQMVVESIAFVGFMFVLVRPRLRILAERRNKAGRLTPDLFAVVLVGVLLSSWVTDRIGIHAIFGAFLFGAVMPRKDAGALSHEIIERVEQLTVLLLLPVFFVVTGLNVDVTALGRSGLVDLAAVVTVACVGKFVGATAAAMALNIRPRRAASIGVLVNTRGLTELVVLNIGLAVGILDRELFSVMVLMAIITTVMTEPILRFVYPDRAVARDIVEAERATLGLPAEHRVLVLVGESVPERVVDAGVLLLGEAEESELLISRIERRPMRSLEVGSGLSADMLAVATSLEDTQRLSRRATAKGARVQVDSQLSDDPVDEALLRAEVSSADVVVVSEADSELAAALAERGTQVVVVVPDSGPPWEEVTGVLVRPGTSGDGLAAVEQAVRVAERMQLPTILVVGDDRREQRRASGIERRFREVGLAGGKRPVTFAAEEPGELWLKGHADAGTPPATPALQVHGTRTENAERLDAMLDRRARGRSR